MQDDGGRKFQAHWWEILVPLFVLLVGITALSRTPLDHAGYALLGVLICALAAWFSIVLARRCGLFNIFDRLKGL